MPLVCTGEKLWTRKSCTLCAVFCLRAVATDAADAADASDDAVTLLVVASAAQATAKAVFPAPSRSRPSAALSENDNRSAAPAPAPASWSLGVSPSAPVSESTIGPWTDIFELGALSSSEVRSGLEISYRTLVEVTLSSQRTATGFPGDFPLLAPTSITAAVCVGTPAAVGATNVVLAAGAFPAPPRGLSPAT